MEFLFQRESAIFYNRLLFQKPKATKPFVTSTKLITSVQQQ